MKPTTKTADGVYKLLIIRVINPAEVARIISLLDSAGVYKINMDRMYNLEGVILTNWRMYG